MPIWSFLFANLRQRIALYPESVCVKSSGSAFASPSAFLCARAAYLQRGLANTRPARTCGRGAGCRWLQRSKWFINSLSAPVVLPQEPRVSDGLYLLSNLFSCFFIALQRSPELPKQRSGILSAPEHTWLPLLFSAEYTVPPISPGPQVLTYRPARAQTPAIWCPHHEEPQRADCDAV